MDLPSATYKQEMRRYSTAKPLRQGNIIPPGRSKDKQMLGPSSITYISRAAGLSSASPRYRYDGQMGIEDLEVGNMGQLIPRTQYGLGARGIDVIAHTTATANTISYPIYDAHGNMTAQLMKNGSGFTVNNEKSFDAWGAVRSGNSNPEYKGRYCANLGHKQDDASGLIYMRARYYEPSSGRFVSQDPAGDGDNWFTYGSNNPVNNADRNGKCAAQVIGFLVGAMIAAIQTWTLEYAKGTTATELWLKVLSSAAVGGLGGAASTFGPWAAAGAAALGNLVQSIVGDLISSGGDWGGVNWKKAAVAAGIGGTVGLAFGAIGASYGRNLAVKDALLDLEQLGSGLGEFTGAAVGNAFGNGFYP